ncbi:MAG: SDR family oxidoreductase [Proteobacteria bacterium]|nr:SDR family oxidoreductase [Pseudomonadota bacterium]MBU1389489.1 SDR family oxidoreductase [Pseudomonadota bacterium]MBU1541309.1 SDR family oxidoreductase [Pseudomonadota bacterium]MBU2430706.1 SDR family oxidoreductase [Pseudomonadota bacterium]MBU2480839.1 SDR family oxidoreductase [Pseudomonadota bacterium]
MIDYLSKFKLDGKIAFVVGGLGLIGREVSIAYATAGAKTIVLDVNTDQGELFEKTMKKKGYPFFYKHFDCSDMDSLDENFLKLLKEFSSPNIFINCSYPRTEDWVSASFEDISLKSFQKNVDIHMNSFAWSARLAAEAMRGANQGGSIIQLGSTYGVVGQDLTIYENTDMHENMAYAVIKGGITNLTRQMASYYGKYDIRVNTLCPGGLEGPVAGKSNAQSKAFVKQYSNRTPLKRLGWAEEVASSALFLASDAASYITGATIMVDGGWTAV